MDRSAGERSAAQRSAHARESVKTAAEAVQASGYGMGNCAGNNPVKIPVIFLIAAALLSGLVSEPHSTCEVSIPGRGACPNTAETDTALTQTTWPSPMVGVQSKLYLE